MSSLQKRDLSVFAPERLRGAVARVDVNSEAAGLGAVDGVREIELTAAVAWGVPRAFNLRHSARLVVRLQEDGVITCNSELLKLTSPMP